MPLVACELGVKGKVSPVILVGPPMASLQSPEDEARVAALVPADGGYASRTTSVSLTVSGTCITGSVAVKVSVASADIALTLACDVESGAFSSALDLSSVADGQVSIYFGFLKSLVSEGPVYELTRTITKDTAPPDAFSTPGTLTEGTDGAIGITSVTDAAMYRTTFTPLRGRASVGPVETTTTAVPVSALTLGTTYSVTVVAIDAAGNETVSSNTPLFTKAAVIQARLASVQGGIASLQFYKHSGVSATYCTTGFSSCNPNANVTADRTTVTVNAGQTITIASNLTAIDMYYFSAVERQKVNCTADPGSAPLWEFVTASATLMVSCVLDPPNPTNFAAAVQSSTAVNLSWTASGGATAGYRIAYKSGATAPADCSTSGTGITLVAASSITGTSYAVTGLTASTQYAFRLCSIDGTPEESLGVTTTATTSSAGGGGTALALASGRGSGGHVCAVVNGGVKCWGNNSAGQLGDGTQTTRTSAVTAIASGSGATDVTVGQDHTCAVVSGALKCWGSDNQYQLGDGATAKSDQQHLWPHFPLRNYFQRRDQSRCEHISNMRDRIRRSQVLGNE
jgi:hypothetical protein